MRTIALWLWYRGESFRGYQSQPQGPTVQDALESALAQLSVRARPVAAGRTDLGVHARMQVVRLRLRLEGLEWTAETLAPALRPLLPDGLGLAAARPAARGFHPQWHAEHKEYRYRLCLTGPNAASAVRDEDLGPVWRTPWKVEPVKLETAIKRCLGRRDFSAFHEKSSPIKSRDLMGADLRLIGERNGTPIHEVRWVGSGFGRYQVRYLTGTTTAVAAGVLPYAELEAALDSAKPIAGVKAPATGLLLWEVRYSPEWNPFGADAHREAEEAIPTGLPFAESL